MSKHTPGPWKLAEYNSLLADNDVLDSAGRLIAEVVEWEVTDNPNARLIAAAPELLEALENLVRWQETGNNPPIASDWAKACKAIAKAKGE